MKRFATVGIAATLLMMLGIAWGQGTGDDVAPQIIAVQPFPGEEMRRDEPLTITFNQAMDQTSVSDAFALDPALDGSFEWTDARTLTFTPNDGWAVDGEYSLTITESATAENGLTLLETYEADLRAAASLQVTAIIPADGVEGVAVDATITVSFNRPVVALGSTADLENLPAPLVLDPPIRGDGEWLNTSIYQFIPSEALLGGASYQVTVSAGLEAVSGAILTDDVTINFKTLVPEILSTYPNEGSNYLLLDEVMTVNFSQPMAQETTAAAMTIRDTNGEPISGEKTWSEDGRSLTFTPTENLTIASPYTFSVDAAQAQGLGGATIRQGRDFTFNSVPLPFVSNVNPDGSYEMNPGLISTQIRFGTPMNPDTFEGKYTISPDPGDITPYASSSSLGLQFSAEAETEYTVTLLAGTEDIYGNAIESDYVYSFKTSTIPDSAFLQDSYRFVVTGAYRQDTALAVQTSGTPEVSFALYELTIDQLESAVGNLYSDNSQNRLRANPRESWATTLETGSSYSVAKVAVAGEDAGVLPVGLYYLEMRDLSNPDRDIQPVAFGVVNSNVTFKASAEEILVWVTDMETGIPLANQRITIYARDRAIGSGSTDAEGVFRLSLDIGQNTNQFFTITSESEGRYGVWYTYSTPPRSEGLSVYTYTDRPIYRPAETLYFRGVVRERDDVDFSPTGLGRVRVEVNVNYGELQLFNEEVELTSFGTFSGEIELPEDMPTGNVNISIFNPEDNRYLGEISAQVAEFRVPEFRVNVAPQQDEIITGDPLRALVDSTFFSGGQVSNADLRWNIFAGRTFFNYTGEGRYSFSDQNFFYGYYDFGFDPYYGDRYVTEGAGTTDSDGNFLIEFENASIENTNPERFTVEASVTDESGQTISNRSTITVHPSEVYVGIRTEQYFATTESPFTVDLITVTPQSNPVSEHNVTVKLIERRWEQVEIPGSFGRYDWEINEIDVEEQRITTDANGRATLDFTAPNAGIFIVRVETRDDRERLHVASTRLYVTGENPVYWGRPDTNLELITNADSYVPGDVAEVLIPISYEGTSQLLITTERAGVMNYEIHEVNESSFVYTLPLEDIHAPNVYISVVLIHGIDDDNSVPSYREGLVTLNVEPINQRLNLTVTPSTNTTQPGEEVILDIEARNPDGNPAQAEVGIAMVDSAILTLAPPNSQSQENFFYGNAGNFTSTHVMLRDLVDGRIDETFGEELRTTSQNETEESFAADDADGAVLNAAPAAIPETGGGGGGGGGGFDTVTVREDFQQTPLWVPHTTTNSDGIAQLTVTLPDNLTIWDVDARAVTIDTLIGDVNIEIASTLPLLVRPVTPRFFVVGDEVTLAMVVNNNTPNLQSISTTMQGTGFELLDGESLVQDVEVDANGRTRVEWRVKILDVNAVDLTFIAQGEDGIEDASKPPLATGEGDTIPVYRYTAPDTTGTGGVLREGGAITEGISIPPIADTDQGTLTLQLDPSLAVTTIDALDYLENYPHQCIEQTVSRFLPNVMTARALNQLGVDDPSLRANAEEQVRFGIEKLTSAQNADGGWGWFEGMESNSLVTAYALLGLAEANNSGFSVPSDMITRARDFVQQVLISPNEDSSEWQLNRQAFFLYVISRTGGDPSFDRVNKLFDLRLELSLYAKGYLLNIYANIYPDQTEAIDALVSDLTSAAKLSATGAHWEEDYHDWWNWNTDIRSTSIVLSALIAADIDNPLLPNAVRWLMVARQGDHWSTTQETTWAVLSLTDWMVATNELDANYGYQVALNSEEQTAATVTPDNVREGQDLVIEVKDLLLDEINRVSIIRSEGEGALYYTAHLQLRLDASEAPAIDRGVNVTREYFVEGQDDPVTSLNMGETATVRVTVTVDETLYYFVLEDPIPAGTEIVDTSLLTTSQTASTPNLVNLNRNPYYYWYWWVWDQTDIRDEQVRLYADQLPPGTYVYSYQIQATVPGAFQTMPSHGYAFYFPEVFGRSDGILFTVSEVPEAVE